MRRSKAKWLDTWWCDQQARSLRDGWCWMPDQILVTMHIVIH